MIYSNIIKLETPFIKFIVPNKRIFRERMTVYLENTTGLVWNLLELVGFGGGFMQRNDHLLIECHETQNPASAVQPSQPSAP